jgi:hypothetical protein
MNEAKRFFIRIGVCGLFTACSTEAQSPKSLAPDPSIGIAKFALTEGSTELQIVGTDSKGAVVGQIILRTGRFRMEEDGREADGRRLEVKLGNVTAARHESDGYGKLHLPVPADVGDPRLGAFLVDAAPALAKWGVEFQTQSTGWSKSEMAYNGCVYNWPTGCAGGTTATSCCGAWGGSGGQNEWGCCGNTNTLFMRACADATNSCGNAGPNGCAGCWSFGYSSCSTSGGSTCSYTADSCTPSCSGVGCGSGDGCGGTCCWGSGCYATNQFCTGINCTCRVSNACATDFVADPTQNGQGCGCGGVCSSGQCVGSDC